MENLKTKKMSMEDFFDETFSREFIDEVEIEYRIAHAAGRSKFEKKWCSRCEKNETPTLCVGCFSDKMSVVKPNLFTQQTEEEKTK